MIMPSGRHLLLPANPRFMALSLLLALMLHMLLGLANQGWMPDVLALVLAFWTVHQPRRVGMLVAFVLGLAADVHESALLGQNALAYVLMSHFASVIRRRVLWFPLHQQALQMLPVFVLPALVEWVIRFITDGLLPQWPQLIAPLLQSALWPVFGHALLAPQRRPVERDDIRPL